MKFSVSNIAWSQHDDPQVFLALRKAGVVGIELAPTKIWANWTGYSSSDALRHKGVYEEEGFEIPAMQAILFGRDELQVFNPDSHKKLLDHMRLVVDMAQSLGAKVLVFGAPKNRKRGQLSMSNATQMAAELFNKIGDICLQGECCIGLEHNPVEYGCDFITNVADARDFVDKVDHHAVKLHLDSAGIHMCGGDIADVICGAGKFCHYHISEPMLEPIFRGLVDHEKAINTLKELKYARWVSIEMKQPESQEDFLRSLEIVSNYLN